MTRHQTIEQNRPALESLIKRRDNAIRYYGEFMARRQYSDANTCAMEALEITAEIDRQLDTINNREVTA